MRKVKPNPNRGRVAPRPIDANAFVMNDHGWRAPCGTQLPFGSVPEYLQQLEAAA